MVDPWAIQANHVRYKRLRFGICAIAFLVTCTPSVAIGEPLEKTKRPACDPDNGGLILSEDFCAFVVADGIGRPRHIDVSDTGDIYVRNHRFRGRGRGETETEDYGILALRDTNGDGRADIIERFDKKFGTGLELRNEYLYVSTSTEIYRYRLVPGQLLPVGQAELIVSEFPEQRGHADKAFAFDDGNNLFVNVGAPSNACMQQARTAGSVGLDPCPQLERQASIWRFDADRIGQRQVNDGYQYVKGIRNIVGIAWDSDSQGLYAAQHGRDSLSTLFGSYFNAEESAELPSEELFLLKDSDNFGWPYCYYDHFRKQRILAPEYGGNGESVGQCGQYKTPVVAFPGHWGPNDLLFYTGDHFPARYREGVFVVFHGSWNRAPLEQRGYKIVFAPKIAGEFTGEWESFADGFAGVSPLISPRDALHRPAGIAQGPDGSVYVTDDSGGRIWRILYIG